MREENLALLFLSKLNVSAYYDLFYLLKQYEVITPTMLFDPICLYSRSTLKSLFNLHSSVIQAPTFLIRVAAMKAFSEIGALSTRLHRMLSLSLLMCINICELSFWAMRLNSTEIPESYDQILSNWALGVTRRQKNWPTITLYRCALFQSFTLVFIFTRVLRICMHFQCDWL